MEMFVDAYDWVMVPNVYGMSQFADGGRMSTKPYAGGGAYINRMSDHCGRCAFDPRKRLGDDALWRPAAASARWKAKSSCTKGVLSQGDAFATSASRNAGGTQRPLPLLATH